ncbi:MAG TPA: VOC family protein [Microbacteriaceae bacterium]|nr:VOC family protein [Microbacteriaceae bacterium]
MNLALSRAFVQINDPDEAIAFYRDALGLEVLGDVAKDAFRWITVGAVGQPGVEIVLTNYLAGNPADADAIAALIAKGALTAVHFRSDDVDATFERLREAGAEIVHEPTDESWGPRGGVVRDPSGNLIRIDQPPAAGS